MSYQFLNVTEIAHSDQQLEQKVKELTAIDVSIDPISPLRSNIVIPLGVDGTFVVFITPQNNADDIRIATGAFPNDWWAKKPPNRYICQRKPGDSYILIVDTGCGCKIEGVSTVRYFSLRRHIEGAAEADRAIEAYKDIYKNI